MLFAYYWGFVPYFKCHIHKFLLLLQGEMLFQFIMTLYMIFNVYFDSAFTMTLNEELAKCVRFESWFSSLLLNPVLWLLMLKSYNPIDITHNNKHVLKLDPEYFVAMFLRISFSSVCLFITSIFCIIDDKASKWVA